MIIKRAKQNNFYVHFQKVRLGNPENDPVEIGPENEACNVSKSVAKDMASSSVLGSPVPRGFIPPKVLVVATDLIQSGNSTARF
jgi:hypothetical protein